MSRDTLHLYRRIKDREYSANHYASNLTSPDARVTQAST